MMQQYFDPDAYPYLYEFTTEHVMRPDYHFGTEFEHGLDLILDALDRSDPDNTREPPHGVAGPPAPAAHTR